MLASMLHLNVTGCARWSSARSWPWVMLFRGAARSQPGCRVTLGT